MRPPKTVATGSIGVFAPSSPFTDERFNKGISALEGLGFSVRVHPQAREKLGFLAGTDAARVAALHELLADDSIDAIFAARGGYGMHRIADKVDYGLIARARKPIVGFSDVCALHAGVQRYSELISIHGPVVTQLGELGEADRRALKDALSSPDRGLRYQADGPAITGGKASGTLTGGCLAVIVALVGTPYLFLPEDAILLLEDVGEATYRIDRMLTHLHLAGVLRAVRGVALGDFIDCNPQRDGEQSIHDVLSERLGRLGVPVLAGLPFGHGRRNQAIPLGAKVTLDADRGTLSVDGP
jgi:muramoyltetrapeptide carboxypeptidase